MSALSSNRTVLEAANHYIRSDEAPMSLEPEACIQMRRRVIDLRKRALYLS